MKERFYFPIVAAIYEGYEDFEPYDASNETILHHLNEINSELEDYQDFGDETMLDFLKKKEGVGNKLTSLKWAVCELDNKPFGYVEIEFTEDLTDTEISSLKDWISGQNSDGLGEGFEQRCFDTDDGDMYVSLWNSTSKTQNRLKNKLKFLYLKI